MSERAPDSIEPYIGFKFLKLTGGFTLYSNSGSVNWPHGKALEAECYRDWGYEWEVVDRYEVHVPYKKGKRNEGYGGSTVLKPQWWIEETPLSYKPPKRPKIELPGNLAWSYNKQTCPHDPVAEDCACGIYVVDSSKEAAGYAHYGRLLVKVALWGKVIVGDKGARGQFAYPLEIVGSSHDNDRKIMEGVGIAYGVPFPGYVKPTPVASDSTAGEQHAIQTSDHGDDQPQLADVLAAHSKIRTWLNL